MDGREKFRQLARESIARGDLTGWFERLYAGAQGDPGDIWWADLEPNPHLLEWVQPRADDLRGKRALVVGCGLGDDAEALAEIGMDVTAFDISPTAVEWCQRRFPDSTVAFVQADATSLPAEWRGVFDLVVEIYTLQVLVPELRQQAAQSVAACVAPGGLLFIVCRAREPSDPEGQVPWPLTKDELDRFLTYGLREISFDDFMDGDVRRFRAVYRAA